jgi:hypothetical protein
MFQKVKYSMSVRELFYSDLLMSSRNKIFRGASTTLFPDNDRFMFRSDQKHIKMKIL